MIETLNIVKGAVANKAIVPVLTHFHIYDGRVQGSNGKLCIDAPLPELSELELTVPAVKFMQAVKACKGTPKLNVTPTGRLSVSSSTFRALLPLLPAESFPRSRPDGQPVQYGEGLVAVLKTLRPFVSEDASRPWSQSILLRDGYAYATNNIVLVRVPYECSMELVIPAVAVDEIIRIGEQPTVLYVSQTRVSLGYESKVWLSCQFAATSWPNVASMLIPGAYPAVPEKLLAGVLEIVPFCEDPKIPIIHFNEHGISTSQAGSLEAAYNAGVFPRCAFRVEPLLAVLNVAEQLDFSFYPKPCPFNGPDGIEGIIVGVRL